MVKISICKMQNFHSAFCIFMGQEAISMEITLRLDPDLFLFYARIAATAGVPLPQVLSDALFRLAGELSLEALKRSRQNDPTPPGE